MTAAGPQYCKTIRSHPHTSQNSATSPYVHRGWERKMPSAIVRSSFVCTDQWSIRTHQSQLRLPRVTCRHRQQNEAQSADARRTVLYSIVGTVSYDLLIDALLSFGRDANLRKTFWEPHVLILTTRRAHGMHVHAARPLPACHIGDAAHCSSSWSIVEQTNSPSSQLLSSDRQLHISPTSKFKAEHTHRRYACLFVFTEGLGQKDKRRTCGGTRSNICAHHSVIKQTARKGRRNLRVCSGER